MSIALGAFMGMQHAQRQADQKERFNKAQAELTRYSPWTGIQGHLDNSYNPSSLEGAFGGAMQGAALTQQVLKQMGGMPGGPGQPGMPQAGMMAQSQQPEQAVMPGQAASMNSDPTLYGSSWGRLA